MFYQILLEKALKMKENVTDNSGAKITHFKFFNKLSAASFWCKYHLNLVPFVSFCTIKGCIFYLHTTLKLDGGELVSELFWTIVSENFSL